MDTITPPFPHLPPPPAVAPAAAPPSPAPGGGATRAIVVLLILGALGLLMVSPILFLMLMSANPGC